MSDIIKEGDYVIAKLDTVLRVVQVRKDRPLFLGKRMLHIGSTIGHNYGSFFEIKRDGSLQVQKSQSGHGIAFPKAGESDVRDNRSLVNSGDSQKLTTDDIEAFKAGGVPGEEIVKIIVENSSSFKEKSVYSQEKYLKKKQLKYMEALQILRPNTRVLVETYYCYSPQKICNLRMDSLSQMLTFCNVMSGGKYVVVDSVLGLLTAAVLERIGSKGTIVQICMASSPTAVFKHAVDALNLPSEHLQSVLHTVNYHKAMAILQSEMAENVLTSEFVSVDESNSNNSGDEASKECDYDSVNSKHDNLMKVKDILIQKDMDGLLVAVKHHPSCVHLLLEALSYSRPFAIFSMYEQPLVDCYSQLKARGDVILLNITETWLRKYQVLPERTHPEYMMSANGGFLLTGIKVEKKS